MLHIIVGPTASGKSEAAHIIASFLNAPIINIDAFQIYKDMDIGTNKIKKDDPYYSRYSLLDVLSPEESFNISLFQSMFRDKVDKLSKKSKDIVVVGGSGLYLRASIYDYVFKEEKPSDLSEYNNKTNEELHEYLAKIDPKSAEMIHVNNRKRIIRAIEIYKQNQVSKSELNEKQNHDLIYPKDEVKIYFINPDRELLYENINLRVENMFNDGLVGEVKSLLKKYNLSMTAKAAIGYKEVISYLNGDISLEECKELIKKNTRNYAKRQITFFKHQFVTTTYSSKDELIKEFTKNEQSIW